VLSQLGGTPPGAAELGVADRWILSRLHGVIRDVHANYAAYRLDLVAQVLYDFTWHELCDWYLELTKAVLADDSSNQAARRGAQQTLAEVLGAVGTTLAIVFFWLVGHARLQRYSLAFVPLERRGGVRRAWNDIESRLGRWFRGQVLLMGAVGLMCGVAYVVLGVPSALLLALIAALCEAIPLVGPILGAIPAVLAALTVSPELALAVGVACWIIQLVENHVLVPVVMRNSIGLSPLIVILSLLVGGAAGGLLGAVVAVPVAAAIEVVLGRLQDREVPVAQDSGAVDVAEPDADDREASLPDARGAAHASRRAAD
jgi:predicted PurR-regulated permease PerM